MNVEVEENLVGSYERIALCCNEIKGTLLVFMPVADLREDEDTCLTYYTQKSGKHKQ